MDQMKGGSDAWHHAHNMSNGMELLSPCTSSTACTPAENAGIKTPPRIEEMRISSATKRVLGAHMPFKEDYFENYASSQEQPTMQDSTPNFKCVHQYHGNHICDFLNLV